MRIGILRVAFVAVLAVMLVGHQLKLSAQHPGQFQGLGWLTAYGGGASPTGALGPISDAVSPPLALGVGEIFEDISDISTTGARTLIARRQGSVWSIGGASPHQVASLVDVYRVATGGTTSFAIDTGGVLWQWSESAPAPVVADLGDVFAVDANETVAVASQWDGALWTWNHATGGAPVRVAAPADFGAFDVAVGETIAVARSFNGEVIAWNVANPASVERIATDVAAVDAGGAHIVLAKNDGTVQTRGANDHGQRGNGSTFDSTALVTVPALSNVVDVAAGASHSVAVTAEGLVYAWGSNSQRQLLVPTAVSDVPAPVMAKDVPRTARYAVATGNTTILLSDPGALAITHNIETYPFEFECGVPFSARVSITGFDATGGVTGQSRPGLTNLAMVLNVAPEFVRSGGVTATAGTVSLNGSQITWTLPSLGASAATLNLRLLPSGPEGEFAVFAPFTYSSDEYPAAINARYPIAFHRACAPPTVEEDDTLPPVIASVTPSRTTLAPPNQQMIPVTVAVAATDNASIPVCSITGVTSNEPIAGDWEITGPLALRLRAERSGHGNGRTYRIAVRCVDDAGNSAVGSTEIVVPRGKHRPHGKAKAKPKTKSDHHGHRQK